MRAEGESYMRFGNGHPFEPEPRFYNHQCHWAPWAEHYRDHDNPTGTLANMLGSALEENDRVLKRAILFTRAQSALLWAFIDLVETGEAKPFPNEETPETIPNALALIALLSKWRRENKLNIRAVDVS